MPEVSIIVPCYNVENYLEDCISSLLNQTFKDIEIICVNDGSKDSTPMLLENFSQQDKRIKIINKENGGLSSARNSGIQNASGNFITFIDSDDWVDNNYIEKLYSAIIKNDCAIAVSGMIRKRPNSEKYRLHFSEEKVYENLQDIVDICRIPACCYACGKLFKKSLIENSPFKLGMYFEDVLWIPNILKAAKKLVTVPDTYYYYRVNNNSIVKTIQSIKKQHDSYIAKSAIVKFFNENNLVLNKKAQHITKYIKYIFGAPVLKVKEYKNTETTLLFGFLPISKKKITSKNLYYKFKKYKKMFLYKRLDSHIYINFFGIHLSFKTNDKFCPDNSISPGLNENKRIPSLIVSLTSFPGRINTVHHTIETLLKQTLRPDRLILWLSDNQFPNKEDDLPNELLKLKEFGLEILWCEDLKSYKKLVPALKMFPNDIIITADDDMYYQKDWLQSLYEKYLENPNNIYTRRACRIEKKGDYFMILPHYLDNNKKIDFSNQLMGGAGTLYPPNSLHSDIFDKDKILNLIPTFDDIYFWAMAVMAGTKIGLVQNKDLNFYNVENSQNEALCKTNGKSQNMNDIEAFNIIFEQYPQIIQKLEN